MAWRNETFDNISIPVPTDAGNHNLVDLLKSYLSPELIHGYICNKCSAFATRDSLKGQIPKEDATVESPNIPTQRNPSTNNSLAKIEELISMQQFESLPELFPDRIKVEAKTLKETQLAYAPRSLCLHLQRSVYLPNGRLVKNSAPVVFPEQLDLKSFVETETFVNKSSTMNYSFMNAVTDLGRQNMKNAMEVQEGNSVYFFPSVSKHRIAKYKYTLKAVILHYGHHESGHFIAIRKVRYKTSAGIQDAWFRISDSTVEKVTDVERDVFNDGSRNVYMLFYEEVTSQS